MRLDESAMPPPRIVFLADDLLLEILARVPYRSLCRFQAVSRSWRLALCSHPALPCNTTSPQTLSGFFYLDNTQRNGKGHRYGFINVAADGCSAADAVAGGGKPVIDPSHWFHLPGYAKIKFVDSCNGLLLLRCWRRPPTSGGGGGIDYVVCNPATEQHVVLPPPDGRRGMFDQIRLGFDPAVSLHFRVFLLLHRFDYSCCDLKVYSSESKKWRYIQSEWRWQWRGGTPPRPHTVFFKGSLHITTQDNLVLAVDAADGRAWRKIHTPCCFSFVGHCQGHLYAVQQEAMKLVIWFLEDYNGDHWEIKHAVDAAELLGKMHGVIGDVDSYTVVGFHPDRDVVFLYAGVLQHLVSYDMESGKLRFICTGGPELKYSYVSPYLPYIPCYSVAGWMMGSKELEHHRTWYLRYLN